jgi:S1-C subfamily serine protease
VSQISNNRV